MYSGGDEELSCIIKQLKSIFKAGAERTEIFEYIDVYLQQNNDCSIILDQNQYINTINVIQISPEQSIIYAIIHFSKRKLHS